MLAQLLVSFSGAHTTKFDYCAPNCNHILISSTNTYIYIKKPLPIPESLSKSIFGGGESEVVLQMESSKYFPVLTALPPLPSELAMRVLLPSPLTLLRIRGPSSENAFITFYIWINSVDYSLLKCECVNQQGCPSSQIVGWVYYLSRFGYLSICQNKGGGKSQISVNTIQLSEQMDQPVL